MHWIAQVSRDVIVDFFAVLVLFVVFIVSFVSGVISGFHHGRKWEKGRIDESIAKKLGVQLT